MASDADIWNEVGTLTLEHDEQGGIALPPPYEPDDKTGPLREILGTFLAAAPEVRSRFSLVLETGRRSVTATFRNCYRVPIARCVSVSG